MVDQSLQEALAQLPRAVVFVELAERGSFRAAAKALGLSPSTVTHHIQALEETLGVRLIERSSRAMTLTEAGRTFLLEATDIVSIWRRGAAGARSHAEAPKGTLVVTAPDFVSERFVVPAITRLVARHPEVRVELRVSTATLDLLTESIDVAVRIGPLMDSTYGMRVLDRGRHGIIATPALARRFAPKHPSDVERAPWIRFAPHSDQPGLLGPSGQSHVMAAHHCAQTSAATSFIEGSRVWFDPDRASAPRASCRGAHRRIARLVDGPSQLLCGDAVPARHRCQGSAVHRHLDRVVRGGAPHVSLTRRAVNISDDCETLTDETYFLQLKPTPRQARQPLSSAEITFEVTPLELSFGDDGHYTPATAR